MVNSLKDFTNDINEDKNEVLSKVKNYAELLKDNPNIVPVISISNKTGYYVDIFKEMLKNLEPREIWKEEKKLNGSIFYIDSKFTPPGVGLVVSGILKGDSVKAGSEMYLGPYGKEFIPIRVWSIHNNVKENIPEIKNREHGCLAFKVLNKKLDFKKDMIRKGMLIVTKNIIDNICYQFQCKIKILNHSTTISKNYSPVIHCGTITQTAKIILEENQELKMGDVANVGFRFIQHPEFVEPEMVFFFREGSTRGVGTVESILPLKDDPNPHPAREQRRNRGTKKRRRKRNKNNDNNNNN